jgi:hypothetical protein
MPREQASICPECQSQRPLAEFPARGRRCVHCRRAGVQRHYSANRQYYLDKSRERRRRIIAENRAWLVEYLLTHPCVDCGATDIRVLEFDHRDRTTKVVAVSVLARGGHSLERVQAEVERCEVRCANCHRIRTHQQRVGGAATWQSTSAEEKGAPGETRTPNLLIRSQVLYPLSYGRLAE